MNATSADARPGAAAATPARWLLAVCIAFSAHACLLFGWQWNGPARPPLSGAGERGVEINLEAMPAPNLAPWRETAKPASEPAAHRAASESPAEPLPVHPLPALPMPKTEPVPAPAPEIRAEPTPPRPPQSQTNAARPVRRQTESARTRVSARKTSESPAPARPAKAHTEAETPEEAADASETRPEAADSQRASTALPPSPLSNPKPAYPALARQRGQEGLVVLVADVDERGAVVAVLVETSSGHSLLDQAAASAVMKWRFRPGQRAGMPSTGQVVIPVAFRLRDEP